MKSIAGNSLNIASISHSMTYIVVSCFELRCAEAPIYFEYLFQANFRKQISKNIFVFIFTLVRKQKY